MKRRDFLKGALALPVVAALPTAFPTEPAYRVGVDLGRVSGDFTAAWRTWHDPITNMLHCEPISASEFYAAHDEDAAKAV